MHYLAALDLDCYMPRRVLVHAPAPKLCRLPLSFELKIESVLGTETVNAETAISPICAAVHTDVVYTDVAHAAAFASTASATVMAGTELPSIPPLGNKGAGASELLASFDSGKLGTDTLSGGKAPGASKPSSVSVGSAVTDNAVIVNTGGDTKEAVDKVSRAGENIEIKPFSLSIWRVGSLLLVDSRSQDVFLPTDRLFYNLLGALGFVRAEISVAEILNWPLVPIQSNQAQPKIAQYKKTRGKVENFLDVSVRTDIQAFFDGKMCQGRVSNMFLLGELASKYLLPSGKYYRDCLYQQIQLSELSVAAVILPSLSEILLKPALKERVWKGLRGFKNSLE